MRALLDASVWIIAVERPDSNSSKIVRHALAGRLEVVVDESVLAEVSRFLRSRHGRSFTWLYIQQIRRVARVMSQEECEIEMRRIGGRLKPADRLHLAAARAAGAEFLIGFDEDFEPYPEYLTPKRAVRRLGLAVSPTEW